MPPGEHPRHELSDIPEIVPPLHVCPLVNHDAIELGSRKVLKHSRRNRNDWSATPDHGRGPHVVRDNELRGATLEFHSCPVAEAAFQGERE